MNMKTKDLLHSLAITGNYKGYPLSVIACHLVNEDGTKLYDVTKRLYPKVAALCNCKTEHVERNIRTVILRAWKLRRKRLNEVAGYELLSPPSVTEFIDMLVLYIQKEEMNFGRKAKN